MNPRNCILEDLDPETGTATNWQAGQCGSFVRSPDNQHTAELAPQAQTDDEHRFGAVDIDSRMFASLTSDALYLGGGHDVLILVGPVWAPDSKSVVFLEKRADSGEARVVFLSLGGGVVRVPVPVSALNNPSISWVGSKVIVGEGDEAFQIDPVTKQVGPVTSDISDEIERKAGQKKATGAARARVEELVRRMGGREGVVVDIGGVK